MSGNLLLFAHAGFTWVMVGIMWSVQLAIYPQFRTVSAADFREYATAHSTRIVAVLAPFAPLEVVLAFLVWVGRPAGVSGWLAFGSGLLLVVGWVATGLWYGPLHGRLQTEPYDPALIERLISTNWARTVLWTLRGFLATAMLWVSAMI